MITKHRIVGVVVNLLIVVFGAMLLFKLFAKGLNQPHGELIFHIRIIGALCAISVAFALSLIVLYRCRCTFGFYVLPAGVVAAWLVGAAAVLIPRPYYWSQVTLENRTGRMISTDAISSIGPDGNIGCSGEPFGNSSSALTFFWWYGTKKDRPADLRPMTIQYPANASRGDFLTIRIEKNGQVRLVATSREEIRRMQSIHRTR